jgi:hypothetical protein
MQDVTSLMLNYRECSRNLWNTYFGGSKDMRGLDRVFEEISKLLFEGLVAKQVGAQRTQALTLLVRPFATLPILIRRPSTDGNVYWDQEPDLRTENDGTRLAFIDFYDFFEDPVKDFRFYRCRILKLPRHPKYEGAEALVDISNAQVFHED